MSGAHDCVMKRAVLHTTTLCAGVGRRRQVHCAGDEPRRLLREGRSMSDACVCVRARVVVRLCDWMLDVRWRHEMNVKARRAKLLFLSVLPSSVSMCSVIDRMGSGIVRPLALACCDGLAWGWARARPCVLLERRCRLGRVVAVTQRGARGDTRTRKAPQGRSRGPRGVAPRGVCTIVYAEAAAPADNGRVFGSCCFRFRFV